MIERASRRFLSKCRPSLGTALVLLPYAPHSNSASTPNTSPHTPCEHDSQDQLKSSSADLELPHRSAFSSPASLLTVQSSSTAINVLSLVKITAGLGAFIAPGAHFPPHWGCRETDVVPLQTAFFTSRAFGFSASKGLGGVSAGASIGANTTQPGDAAEQSIAVRLFGARDIGLGLLLRDSTAAVVARALRKLDGLGEEEKEADIVPEKRLA